MVYEPKKTKFLDASEIERGINAVARIASSEKIHVALLGGAALQLFGSTRLTGDIDVVSSDTPESVKVSKMLSFGGIRTKVDGVEIDFIVRNDKYKRLYEAALDHSVRVKGVPIPVIPPEWLVPIKMAAGRPKDNVDLDWMISEKGLLNRKKARLIIEKYLGLYAGDDFDAQCMHADWDRTRKNPRRGR